MMCNILVSHVSLQIIKLFLVTAVSCLRYPVITKGNNNNNEGRAQFSHEGQIPTVENEFQFKALSIQKCKEIYLRTPV